MDWYVVPLLGAGRKFDEFSGETKWFGKNLLVGGKSGINLVTPRYTFVKHGPYCNLVAPQRGVKTELDT
jgi:hypothetical protein